MSVSKTKFWDGIVLLLKEMSKTFTDLSKRIDRLEETNQKLELLNVQAEIITRQHVDLISQVKQLSQLQAEIANQVVVQHKTMDELYIALGLKKPLSYYSFNLDNEEGH
tara:strand:- start:443 stop:769 length:327 start_codon:yes stop_codon:yes gene_type:complete